MTPAQQHDFRANTDRRKHYNTAQRLCKGPCKLRRSLAQFAPGDDHCLKCRRRAPR